MKLDFGAYVAGRKAEGAPPSKPAKRLNVQIPLSVRKALQVCSDVAANVPSLKDNPLALAVKSLAIADSVLDAYAVPRDYVREWNEGYKKEMNSDFVRLFFETELRQSFKISTRKLTEDTTGHEAVGPNGEVLHFTQYKYSDGPDSTFHHSDFSFSSTLSLLWERYAGRIHITLVQQGYVSRRELCGFAAEDRPFFGRTAETLSGAIARHREMRARGFFSTYLLVGKPGTGKSTFAQRLADSIGPRTLKVEATSLTSMTAKDLDFLLTGLSPTAFVIDDVDRADTGGVMSAILSLLERVKVEHRGVTLIMTANDAESMDKALLRPGRIDSVLLFGDPDREERRAVLLGYLGEGRPSEATVERLLDLSDGLTHDYLGEVAKRCLHDSFESAVSYLETIRPLVLKKKPKSPKEKKK